MNFRSLTLVIAFALALSTVSLAQQSKSSDTAQLSPGSIQGARTTAAYAEVLLRKTELEADLEDLMVTYTDDSPKVKATRYELDLINASLSKILTVSVSESPRLTLALGKLLVRKAELETDLWSLKIKYGDEQVEVKRAARKVAAFDKAVKEILP